MSTSPQKPPPHGRGAVSNPPSRFLKVIEVSDEDAFACDDGDPQSSAGRRTIYYRDQARSVISENDSPDIPFRYSLNPYRGCLHGCSYCYARPTHEYFGLSPGLDFESRIFVKTDAANLLRDWLNRPRYVCEPIVMSGVTDCYQPVERTLQITRACLQVAQEARQPVSVITKNALITRDIDLLSALAGQNLAKVAISVTSLNPDLTRQMEPRCSVPQSRLKAIRELSEAGIPVHAMLAPVIPGLNDSEIPKLLEAVADAGAQAASFIALRLPKSVDSIFLEWLKQTFPTHAGRVEQRLRSMRGGNLNSPQFGVRMRGTGVLAEQISALFRVARQRVGLAAELPSLTTTLFCPPRSSTGQGRLF